MFKTTISLTLVALAAFASTLTLPSSTARADVTGDYTIGPLSAVGEGLEAEALAEAQADMLATIADIIAGLGPHESFDGFSILLETSDQGNLPGEVIYTIEFEVYIQSNRPPR